MFWLVSSLAEARLEATLWALGYALLTSLLLLVFLTVYSHRMRVFWLESLRRWFDLEQFDTGSWGHEFAMWVQYWVDVWSEVPMSGAPNCKQDSAVHQVGGVGFSAAVAHPLTDVMLAEHLLFCTWLSADRRWITKIPTDFTGQRMLEQEREALAAICSKQFQGSDAIAHPLSKQERDALRHEHGSLIPEDWVVYENFQRLERDWKRLSRMSPAFDCQAAVAVFRVLLEALARAHDAGFVHTAVLPKHICFRLESSEIKLLGWTRCRRLSSNRHGYGLREGTTFSDRTKRGTDIAMAATVVRQQFFVGWLRAARLTSSDSKAVEELLECMLVGVTKNATGQCLGASRGMDRLG